MHFPGLSWRALITVSAGFVLLGGAVPAAASAIIAIAGPPGAVSGRVIPAAVSSPAAGAASTALTWSPATPLPKSASPALSASFTPELLNCAGTGACSAVGGGEIAEFGGSVVVVDNEVSGAWQQPELLPGITSLITPNGIGSEERAISCGSPGNCTMGGDYLPTQAHDGEEHEAFVATEVNGQWQQAQNIPGLPALDTGESAEVTALSCAAAGDCTAVGYYTTGTPLEGNGQDIGFTVDEVAGKWQPVRSVPNLAGLQAVACASPGDCTVSAANMVESDNKYEWQAPQAIKGFTAPYDTALSCASAGNCAVAYGNQVASSANGVWSGAETVGGQQLDLTTVSCGAPGDCIAGGSDSTANYATTYAYTVTEKNHAWKSGGPVLGIGAAAGHVSGVDTVSCATSGNCAVDGYFAKNSGATAAGFVVSQSQTATSSVQSFGAGKFGPVSCSASSCGALLSQYASNGITGYLDFTQKLLPTTTRLALSTAKVTYGHERSGKLSVAVVPAPDGAATGTVSITTGKKLLCRITLHSAKGSCTLAPTLLKPGSYALIATYAGDKHYHPSVSPARKLTVVQ
jgi:hypothetical protein